MLLPHFKRTNLCARWNASRDPHGWGFSRSEGAYDGYGGEFRPTPERQTLHKAVDDGIRYEQARNIAKAIGRRNCQTSERRFAPSLIDRQPSSELALALRFETCILLKRAVQERLPFGSVNG